MSRSAVLRYQGRDIDAGAVGRELAVDAVVTGRVVGAGDRLTLDLDMVDADDNSYIWGKRYDLTPATSLPFSARFRRNCQPRCGLARRRQRRPPGTTPSIRRRIGCTGLGWSHFSSGTQEAITPGRRSFPKGHRQRSILRRRVRRACGCIYRGAGNRPTLEGGTPPRTSGGSESSGARSRIERRPRRAGWCALVGDDRDFAGTERELRRALELNPSNIAAHHSYSHLLLAVARPDDALAEARKVEELDPVTPLATGHYAYYYLVTRQFDRSIDYFKRYFRLTTNDPGSLLQFAEALYHKGSTQEALDAYLKGHAANGVSEEELAALKDAIAKRGAPGYLQTGSRSSRHAGSRRPCHAHDVFVRAAGLAGCAAGGKQRAFQLLERMYAERDERVPHSWKRRHFIRCRRIRGLWTSFVASGCRRFGSQPPSSAPRPSPLDSRRRRRRPTRVDGPCDLVHVEFDQVVRSDEDRARACTRRPPAAGTNHRSRRSANPRSLHKPRPRDRAAEAGSGRLAIAPSSHAEDTPESCARRLGRRHARPSRCADRPRCDGGGRLPTSSIGHVCGRIPGRPLEQSRHVRLALYSLENDDKPRRSWTVRLPPEAVFERLGNGPGPRARRQPHSR